MAENRHQKLPGCILTFKPFRNRPRHLCVPFAGELCLAFLVEVEPGVTVAPAIPLHHLLPGEMNLREQIGTR